MGVYSQYVDAGSDGSINLNSNEVYMNLDDDLKMKLKESLNSVEFNRYPSNDMSEIKKLYADYADVKPENIIVCNGSDESLDIIIGNIINNDKKVLTLSPDFVMYDFFTNMFKGKLVKYDVGSKMSFNMDEFIALGKSEDVELIVFSNPNNPTGMAVNLADILELLNEFRDKTVIIDEAYYEFNGETVLPYINEFKNLIVTRTLSKAWGLAALRMGFLISNEDNINKFMESKVPYTVSSFSKMAAETVLKDKQRPVRNAEVIVGERKSLYENLKKIENTSHGSVVFFESKSNYIYGRTENKERMIQSLAENNIFIRNFDGSAFRITVGSFEQNKKLLAVLNNVF